MIGCHITSGNSPVQFAHQFVLQYFYVRHFVSTITLDVYAFRNAWFVTVPSFSCKNANNTVCKSAESVYVNVVEAHDWGPWSQWSACSKSCQSGVQFRHRNCTQRQTNGSSICAGDTEEQRLCNTHPCQGIAYIINFFAEDNDLSVLCILNQFSKLNGIILNVTVRDEPW